MDFDDLTLGEIEEIENYANMSITKIGEEIPGVSKLRTGLAWILKRRSNPDFTIEDARKLSSSEMMAMLEGDNSKKD